MSSQLVFNLLSSQECIHRLYHWEEWLPSLVWSRSGNSLHQHIKVGLPFDWWLWDLILQQRCQFSLAMVCHRYMSKPTERQTLFFSSWEMVEQCFLSNKDLCSSCFISQHGPTKVHIGALKLFTFMTKCRGMLWQTNNYLAFSSWSSCNWTAIRCGNISYVVANVAFCFCAILKYEFWKNEEKIIFLKQMCFSASGDSVCIGFFFSFFF